MNCGNCWNFPCTCGHAYKSFSTEALKYMLHLTSPSRNPEEWKAISLTLAQKEEIDRSWDGPGNR